MLTALSRFRSSQDTSDASRSWSLAIHPRRLPSPRPTRWKLGLSPSPCLSDCFARNRTDFCLFAFQYLLSCVDSNLLPCGDTSPLTILPLGRGSRSAPRTTVGCPTSSRPRGTWWPWTRCRCRGPPSSSTTTGPACRPAPPPSSSATARSRHAPSPFPLLGGACEWPAARSAPPARSLFPRLWFCSHRQASAVAAIGGPERGAPGLLYSGASVTHTALGGAAMCRTRTKRAASP